MENYALIPDVDDEHAQRVWMIGAELRAAAAAPSFEEAGRSLCGALRLLEEAHTRPDARKHILSDGDAERLLELIEFVLGKSADWGRHAYADTVGNGLAAAADQVLRWNGEAVATPSIDVNQRARILLNVAHNAAMAKEINDRDHKRRNRRVVSLLEYKAERKGS